MYVIPRMDPCHYILKPVAFTAFVGTASVAGAAIWQYEEQRKAAPSRGNNTATARVVTTLRDLSSQPVPQGGNDLLSLTKAWWRGLTPGMKVFWPICGLNTAVYIAWGVASWTPTMKEYFRVSPYADRVCLPMLLSTFSHNSLNHLFKNMVSLHSFIPAAAEILGKEQLVALFLTSGVVASLGSLIHKVSIQSTVTSLGASGAIYGIIGLVISRRPDMRIGLRGIAMPAHAALVLTLAIEGAGVLIGGTKQVDFAAHLSGFLFGVAFGFWGDTPYRKFRDFVKTKWAKVRRN